MLEKDVERRLVARLKKLGILHVKMTPTAQRGWPDRMICLPRGRVLWIELKAPGRENNLSANQIAIHDKLRSIGHYVLVASDADECIGFINEHMESA